MSLGKSRKSGSVVAAAMEESKDYAFPRPKAGVVPPWVSPASPPSSTSPSPSPSSAPFQTIAPTSTGSGITPYLPYIIGGAIVLVGLGVIVYLKRYR